MTRLDHRFTGLYLQSRMDEEKNDEKEVHFFHVILFSLVLDYSPTLLLSQSFLN